ncbi:MAG: carbohydrate ABC transporter permease [Spirochaetia bacterium]|jgi:ABC-type glycerol-3-phosphate transport system permease component
MAKVRKTTVGSVLIQAPFVLYSLTIVAMIIILVVTPFRSGNDLARGLLVKPTGFGLGNFRDAFDSGLGYGVRNSFILGASTCALTIFLGGIAGYAISFMKFRFRKGLASFMNACIYISTMLIALPLFLQYRDLHLVNNLLGALLIFLGLRLPFSVYLFKSYFDEFSPELIEAAKMDGVSDLRIFASIVFPLSRGVVITVLLFNFSAVWTDYLIGLLFLQQDKLMTIMPKIMYIFGSGPMVTHATSLGQGFAGLFVATLPIVVIYFFTKKYYIEGLTLGSLK